MSHSDDRRLLARLIDENLDALVHRALGEHPSPAWKETVTRMASLLVDRICLDDPALQWQDLQSYPYGVVATCEGLDALREAATYLWQHHLDETDWQSAARAFERAVGRIRNDIVRRATQDASPGLVDVASLEQIPSAFFAVGTD